MFDLEGKLEKKLSDMCLAEGFEMMLHDIFGKLGDI